MAASVTGQERESSSSDSSNEDETRRFQEAAVLDCHHSTSYNSLTENASTGRPQKIGIPLPRQNGVPQKPSLRPSKQDAHEDENELNTTPEFKMFVGKKLSQILDSMVEIGGAPVASSHKLHDTAATRDAGVRLFSNSSLPLSLTESSPVQKPAKKRPVESSSSDSSEDERLASAAVSTDFIFRDLNQPPNELTAKEQNTENRTNSQDVELKKRKCKKKKKSKKEQESQDAHDSSDGGHTSQRGQGRPESADGHLHRAGDGMSGDGLSGDGELRNTKSSKKKRKECVSEMNGGSGKLVNGSDCVESDCDAEESSSSNRGCRKKKKKKREKE